MQSLAVACVYSIVNYTMVNMSWALRFYGRRINSYSSKSASSLTSKTAAIGVTNLTGLTTYVYGSACQRGNTQDAIGKGGHMPS